MPSITRKTVFRTLAVFASILLVAFAVWLVHEANIGRDNPIFKTVRATPYGDKIGHVLFAGALTIAAQVALRFRWIRLARIPIPLGSLVIFALLAVEEASQHFLPTRSLDIYDALANLAGIVCFSLPFYWKRPR